MDNLFITATDRNIGKTSFTIGLLSVLREEIGNVGYMKPIGQRFVEHEGVRVDEDVHLINTIYGFDSRLQDMSPVIIDRHFTRSCIDRDRSEELRESVMKAYERVSAGRECVVFEGAGKCSVGEVFGLSNIRVAELTGARVILIAEGGIGSTIDDIVLNHAYLDRFDIEVQGVIINKVFKKKYREISDITRRGLAKKGIEVLGVIPYEPLLSHPTLQNIIEEFEDIRLLTEANEEYLTEQMNKIIVGAMTPHEALKYFRGGELLITGGDREDILVAALCRSAISLQKEGKSGFCGVIATGDIPPHPSIIETAERLGVMILLARDDTFTTAARIKDLTIKIKPRDREKIRYLEGVVREHVDLDPILKN